MNNKILLRCVIISMIVVSSHALALSYESIDTLADIARQFTLKTTTLEKNDSLQITIQKADISSELAHCDKPIRSELPDGQAIDKISSVRLSCEGTTPWHVIIPVSTTVLTPVVVAKQNIPSHQTVNADDLDVALIDKSHLLNGFFTDNDTLIGQVATQTIMTGSVITKRAIQQPTLVHRNDVIDLTAKNNTIVVTMKGVARSDGGLHEVIKAFNPSSKKLLDALVIGPGKVEVIS